MTNSQSSKSIENVVSLNQRTVYSSIMTHLRSGKKAANTQVAYENDLRQFFNYTRNKKIEDLVESDLMYNAEEVDNYQTFLTLKMKNTTVNRKMDAILSLFNSLERYKYNVDLSQMKTTTLQDDSESHGFLLSNEAEEMARIALGYKDGKEKLALIKLATRTSFRKQDLLSLTWNKIKKSTENEHYEIVTIVQKTGKKEIKEIHTTMYNLLLELKSEKYNDNKIFHLSDQNIRTMMANLCEAMGFDEDRRITFHSFRNTGGGYLREAGYSDMDIADQLGHASVDTSRKYYLKGRRNIAGLAMDEKIDKDIFEQLSRDEMVKLLMSVENGMGLTLRRRAKGIIDGR
jgi:integrase